MPSDEFGRHECVSLASGVVMSQAWRADYADPDPIVLLNTVFSAIPRVSYLAGF